jgi:MFS family permease
MTGHELRTVAVAVAAAVSASLPVFLLGPLAPQIRSDLSFGRTQLGLALGLCQAVSAASSWMLGRQVVRLGSRRATRVGLVLCSLSLLGVGTLASSWITLVGWLALCGMSSAICQPATNALLLDSVAPLRLGRAFGVKMAAIPLTALLAGLSVPLIAAPLGWRAAFLCALAIPIVAFVAAPTPARARRESTDATESPTGTPRSILAMLAVGTGLVIGSATTVPGFFVESAGESGLNEQVAALILAGGAACGIVARLALGAWTDRRVVVRLNTVAVMATAGSAGYLLLRAEPASVQAIGVVMVFTLSWGWVGLFQFLLSTINPANPGSATGLTDTGGYIGAFLGPIAVGLIASRWTFQDAWLVTFGFTLVGATLIAIADRALTTTERVRPLAA